MRTKVYITIDVECAEERVNDGKRIPALGYDVRVWGELANQRTLLGIPLIMGELEAMGFRGTFYVEPLGAHSFGLAGLEAVCRELISRHHDVQLHLHPIQRDAFFRTGGRAARPDHMSAYGVIDQATMLNEGVELLAAAGVPRRDIVSFRAGNFGANNATWEAMQLVGLQLSSNYNPCYLTKGCQMKSHHANNGLFQHRAPGPWELPIGNMLQPDGAYRHMQITAVSTAEMTHYLRQSRALGVGHVVFVTHSFELFHLDSAEGKLGRLNRINHHRLRSLLRFLRENDDQFEVETVRELEARLPEEGKLVPVVRYPTEGTLMLGMRLAEQGIKRVDARLGAIGI